LGRGGISPWLRREQASSMPLPLVPVAIARMLTADGPPREGLQPWQRPLFPSSG
jgi:hypothetical protein